MVQGLDDRIGGIARGFMSLFGPWSEHVEEVHWMPEGDITLLKARTTNGSIVVRGDNREHVLIKAWKTVHAPTEGAASAFARRVRIRVEHRRHGIFVRSFYPRPPFASTVFVRYEILVPRMMDVDLFTLRGGINVSGLEGAVEAEVRNGNIAMEGCMGPAALYTASGLIRLVDVDGAVKAESGGGGIELLESTGQMRLRTTTGDIFIAEAEGMVRARSHSGKIRLQGGRGGAEFETIRGDIDAEFAALQYQSAFFTQRGDVTLRVLSGHAPIEAESLDGHIRLMLPRDFDGGLDAGSGSGGVHLYRGLPITAAHHTDNLLEGQLGEGGDAHVRLRTFDGEIHIRTSEPSGAPQE